MYITTISRTTNNFDLIRFIAAAWVMWDHSSMMDPSIFGNYAVAGYVVPLFGFISGFVICNSILSKKRPLDFLISITTRIYIPLVIVVLICALVVAPIYSDLPASRFFVEQIDGIKNYIFRNLSFQSEAFIPTVFEENHWKGIINGNLWCVQTFFGSYLFLLFLYLVGILRLGKAGGLSVLAIYIIFYIAHRFLTGEKIIPLRQDILTMFAVGLGAATCCLRKHIDVNYRIPLAFLLLDLVARRFSPELAYLSNALFVFSAAFWVAFQPWFNRFRLKHNISLGMFLVSFPVQQIISNTFSDQSFLFNFSVSLVIVCLISYVSAVSIEKYCYDLSKILKAKISNLNQ